MDPGNFVVGGVFYSGNRIFITRNATQNASWSINSLKVYKKNVLTGSISGTEHVISLDTRTVSTITCILTLTILVLAEL
jgi:hypothetical protein